MKIRLLKSKMFCLSIFFVFLGAGRAFSFTCWGVGGSSGIPNYNNVVFKIGGLPGCLLPGHYAVWDFGDGSPLIQGDSVTHTYASPGEYTGKVKVYNGVEVDSQVISAAIQCPISVGLTSTPGNPVCSFQMLDPNNCVNPTYPLLWNFGDSNVNYPGGPTMSHTYTTAGTYQVSLYVVGPGAPVNSTFGWTIINSGCTTEGKIQSSPGVCLAGGSTVEIFGIEDSYYRSIAVPDTGIGCNYSFLTPFNKPVVIRATPWVTGTYLPTYYGNQVYWSEATVIQSSTNLSDLNIQLQTASGGGVGGGAGTISGLVTGNGTVVSTSFNNMTITTTFQANRSHAILLNSANVPVAFAVVAEDGTFSFPNIAEGQYALRIEHPKVNSTAFPVVLNASRPNASVLATATSTGISIITENKKRVKASEITLTPNPAHHTITFSGVTGLVRVLNVQGKVVMETYDSQLNIEALPNGLYTLKATNPDQEICTVRFIKN